MILSTYKQYVKAGGASTIEHFLVPARKHGWRVPGFDFGHFEYDRLIAYYRSLYGPDAVLALPYEQFVGDGRGFVETIADGSPGGLCRSKLSARMPFTALVTRPRFALSGTADSRLAELLRAAKRPESRTTARVEGDFQLAKRLRSSLCSSPATRARLLATWS